MIFFAADQQKPALIPAAPFEHAGSSDFDSRDCRFDSVSNHLNNRIDWHIFGQASCAGEQFDSAFLDLLADRYPIRHADKISIVELDARALVTIVEQRFDANLAKVIVDSFGYPQQLLILDVDRRQHDMEGSNRRGPAYAGLVVVQLDGRAHNALDTNPVASHYYRHFLPIGDEHSRAHAVGVFRSKL